MADQPKKKKVVRVESAPAQKKTQQADGSTGTDAAPTWAPTPESKAKATKLRIFAWIAWVLAIAGEAFAIFWVLKQNPPIFWLLIVMLVVIGALAVGGSLLWKQANRLDPASKADTVRFFVQNQLGVIMSIIAFLPLIILIFMNKDMDGKQKGIAGGIGIVVLLVAAYFGASFNAPSVEQYTQESSTVMRITGQDLVYWTKSGKVFHLCADASAVNLESKDNQIYEGTVADAHAAGKERLTKQIAQEMNQCGYDASTFTPVPDAPAEDAPVEDPVETPAP